MPKVELISKLAAASKLPVWFYVTIVALAFIYVFLAVTPSHYARALTLLGSPTEPWLGIARSIRSDDWAVLTPYFQIALLGKGSVIDVISPYHTSLKAVWPLPILDWSLVFKPQMWSFWILPPAYAFSVYFAFYWISCFVGYAVLFRQLGATISLAILGAVAIYSSHFVQVWWTTHAAAFAYAPWPVVVFLSKIRISVKLPLLYWVISFFLFSDLYPAFIISGIFAFVVMILTFRRDTLTIQNIFTGIIATTAAAGTIYFYFGELFSVLKNTVYPGSRYVGGGGVEEIKMVAHLFPFFTTSQFKPLLSNSNECEIAVVSTFLPLTFIFFVNYHSVTDYLRKNIGQILIFFIGSLLMLSWMLLPVPPELGSVFLWTNVPAQRMVWGFGLLITVMLVVSSSHMTFSFSWLRLFGFSASLVVAWLISKIVLGGFLSVNEITAKENLEQSWFDWIAIIPYTIAGVYITRQKISQPTKYLFTAAVVSGLLTFSTFNPFQSAVPIFTEPNSAFIEKLREDVDRNPNGWAVVPGVYGATINGIGIPAINHVLLSPRMSFFRDIFNDLPDDEFRLIFNRYHHVVPQINLDKPRSPQPDIVEVPLSRFQE